MGDGEQGAKMGEHSATDPIHGGNGVIHTGFRSSIVYSGDPYIRLPPPCAALDHCMSADCDPEGGLLNGCSGPLP